MRLHIVAAIALGLLTGACYNTGDPALDMARWNSWPLESIGHDESKGELAIAALVHRGGVREDHDELAQRITIDRLVRYAAKLASERKALRFALQTYIRSMPYEAPIFGIFVKGDVWTKRKVYPYFRAIMTFPDAATPVPAGVAVFDTNTILTAAKEPLLTLQ